MNRIILGIAALIAWCSLSASAAQNVTVIGPITPGDCAFFNSTTVIKDAGFSCNGAPGAAITGLTGDGTATGPGSVPFTLATVNGNVGTFGSATLCVSTTVNAKGLTTAISAVTCTPAIGSITGLAAGIATWLATPTSANLAAALTDETGTGAAVFASSPALAGIPTAPTAAPGTNTTQLATTAAIVAERSATKTLTNTTLDSGGTGNVLQVNGVTVSRGQYPGTTTNDNATAGNIGEYLSILIPTGSPVSLTSGVTANITSLSLTAGDWDVGGNVVFIPAGTTTTSEYHVSTGITSATLDPNGASGASNAIHTAIPAGQAGILPAGVRRYSLASTTTVFLLCTQTFAVSTMQGSGYLWARRAR